MQNFITDPELIHNCTYHNASPSVCVCVCALTSDGGGPAHTGPSSFLSSSASPLLRATSLPFLHVPRPPRYSETARACMLAHVAAHSAIHAHTCRRRRQRRDVAKTKNSRVCASATVHGDARRVRDAVRFREGERSLNFYFAWLVARAQLRRASYTVCNDVSPENVCVCVCMVHAEMMERCAHKLCAQVYFYASAHINSPLRLCVCVCLCMLASRINRCALCAILKANIYDRRRTTCRAHARTRNVLF